ncbi:hypothetical protein EXIGLDRAFT_833569 [Exidia glandulosa HHB12029]|uniref:Uncharacterized protein n=1 Tax=Exidia glandulosa HHB12029 TaxID=1314781 RepID=A0A165KKE0_EXIGL|nr:hypothetical protein EXIGLDRAFT_833569 [Exidia glandulosa HHB12029]
MYPPHLTTDSNLVGYYFQGMPPIPASSNQSLAQGTPSRSLGDATSVPAGTQNAYEDWLKQAAPYLSVERETTELDPPDEFWAQLVQGPTSDVMPTQVQAQAQAQAQAHVRAQVQAPVRDVASTPSPVAMPPPATALSNATRSTVRSAPFRSQAHGTTAATAKASTTDSRSQSQAGRAANVRRRTSIRIDGPLAVVIQLGARTESGKSRRK